LKHDGFRIVALKDGDDVRLWEPQRAHDRPAPKPQVVHQIGLTVPLIVQE